MKVGDRIELTAGDLSFGGGTVCRDSESGMVVFVPFLAPGDSARVRIEHVRSNHSRGRVLEILRPGPDRVQPRCRVFGECGGCQWQHVSINAQRAAKERIVRHLLAPLSLDALVTTIRSDGRDYRYRNRLILPVRAGRRGLRGGFFQAGTHLLVEMDECAVQRAELWKVAREVLEIADNVRVVGYNETSGRGQLRHIIARAAAGSGDIGVVLVTAQRSFPEGERIANALIRRNPSVTGVLHNVNEARTNVIVGPETYLLAGRGHLEEQVGGVKFRASVQTFFQANAGIAGMIIDLLRDWMRSGPPGGVLDLFCGVGVLGIAAVDPARSEVPWLVGVEESPDSVANARENAPAVPPARFETGTVEDVLPRIARDLVGIGTVIVDPPRKGLSPAAMDAVVGLAAPQLIYVSCDPATFARDLTKLLAAGYSLETVVPLDMFPHTFHIELAARLRRP